jgi:hypothetical protein
MVFYEVRRHEGPFEIRREQRCDLSVCAQVSFATTIVRKV